MRGLSLVAASGGHSSSRCAGLSLSRPLLLRSTGSRRAGSVVVAHGPSCSAACGISPDQGSNPCAPHRQADSQPLRHQGSPIICFSAYFLHNIPQRTEAFSHVHDLRNHSNSPSHILIDSAYQCLLPDPPEMVVFTSAGAGFRHRGPILFSRAANEVFLTIMSV